MLVSAGRATTWSRVYLSQNALPALSHCTMAHYLCRAGGAAAAAAAGDGPTGRPSLGMMHTPVGTPASADVVDGAGYEEFKRLIHMQMRLVAPYIDMCSGSSEDDGEGEGGLPRAAAGLGAGRGRSGTGRGRGRSGSGRGRGRSGTGRGRGRFGAGRGRAGARRGRSQQGAGAQHQQEQQSPRPGAADRTAGKRPRQDTEDEGAQPARQQQRTHGAAVGGSTRGATAPARAAATGAAATAAGAAADAAAGAVLFPVAAARVAAGAVVAAGAPRPPPRQQQQLALARGAGLLPAAMQLAVHTGACSSGGGSKQPYTRWLPAEVGFVCRAAEGARVRASGVVLWQTMHMELLVRITCCHLCYQTFLEIRPASGRPAPCLTWWPVTSLSQTTRLVEWLESHDQQPQWTEFPIQNTDIDKTAVSTVPYVSCVSCVRLASGKATYARAFCVLCVCCGLWLGGKYLACLGGSLPLTGCSAAASVAVCRFVPPTCYTRYSCPQGQLKMQWRNLKFASKKGWTVTRRVLPPDLRARIDALVLKVQAGAAFEGAGSSSGRC